VRLDRERFRQFHGRLVPPMVTHTLKWGGKHPMTRFAAPLLVVVLSLFTLSLAAETKVKVVMGDGSIFYGIVQTKKLSIDTPFGKLTIPIQEINSLLIGNKQRDKIKSFIMGKLKDLAGTLNEEARSKIIEEIAEIGFTAIPLLDDIAGTNEDQGPIIDEIKASVTVPDYVEEESLAFEEDKIFAGESQISGVIANETIEVNSALGPVKLKTENIFSMSFTHEQSDAQSFTKTIMVPSNKYIGAKEFLNTKIKINKGDLLDIKTTGQVVLASLSYQTFYPDGGGSYGTWMNQPFGSLCGKIGDNGQWFLVGSSYKAVAQESGYLWLTISETLYNAGNTGEYKSRITIKKK
jgi:hypothetical protein